jgi:hypothetical protein
MNEQIRKNYMLRARLRNVDLALLEAISNRRGCNLSEAVRQAITNEAAKEGLYNVGGFVVRREAEAKNEQPQQP